jgi:hypothetical protein
MLCVIQARDPLWEGQRTMSILKSLDELLSTLPEDQVRQVLDFARFLQFKQDQDQWSGFGAQQFARAYGPDEPEYTEADVQQSQRPRILAMWS